MIHNATPLEGAIILVALWALTCSTSKSARNHWLANSAAWLEGMRWLVFEMYWFTRAFVLSLYRRNPDTQRWFIRESVKIVRDFSHGLSERKKEIRRALA